MQVWNFKIIQNVDLNENLPKTKVVELEKLHKFGIQDFFIWAQEDRDNFSL